MRGRPDLAEPFVANIATMIFPTFRFPQLFQCQSIKFGRMYTLRLSSLRTL